MTLLQQTIAGISGDAAISGIGVNRLLDRRSDPRYNHENEAVAARLRMRDPEILDELILQYQHRLMRYLIHLTANRELAEDLFQETWMRVMQRGPQFRGNSQFVTWLFTIARNLVFDLKRKGSVTRSLDEITETGDERLLRRTTREQSQFDHTAAQEAERLIGQALVALSPQQREVFVLRFHQEMPLQEIATVTGMPLSTVKARLYRGLAVLKSRMTHSWLSRHDSAFRA
ncbi:MAG TPA: sigma-70 family RNA polymerase sigma factor [Terracidiphilus sp.]|nr:sigma-70 family RNA polymerase sigma factor [Terracidiphilus sp.]